ncbi:MAG: deoxynucleoside kinase [Spirochaetales bacterium]|nr:deoxynucleoside kinase [Spirochaetales bacterium]
MSKQFVAVAGNIGAGKSTLVSRLSERLGWKPYFEPVAENPYLENFYGDMKSWAFHSQVFFLSYRMKTHSQLLQNPESVVQDRSVYEDAEIFARNLYLQQFMSDRDYSTYRNLFDLFISLLDPPDLIIYVEAPVDTLIQRIEERGRTFEADIKPAYLSQLGNLYEEWISNFDLCPVLTVPSRDMDFASRDDYVDVITAEVERKLSGKQETLFKLEDYHWRDNP